MDILITVLLGIFATVMLTVGVVFIPGFGITGFTGVIAMAGSIFYAFVQLGSAAGWITLLVGGMIIYVFLLATIRNAKLSLIIVGFIAALYLLGALRGRD